MLHVFHVTCAIKVEQLFPTLQRALLEWRLFKVAAEYTFPGDFLSD